MRVNTGPGGVQAEQKLRHGLRMQFAALYGVTEWGANNDNQTPCLTLGWILCWQEINAVNDSIGSTEKLEYG